MTCRTMRRNLPDEPERPEKERLTRRWISLHTIVYKRYTAQALRQTVSHLSIRKGAGYNTDGSINRA